MNIEDVLTKKHADMLISRVAQTSKAGEAKIKELGLELDRENPKDTVLALVETLNAFPPADRYKTELTIFGQHCLGLWFAVFDALRTKAPADIAHVVTEAAAVVEAVIDLATPDVPVAPVAAPAKEAAAAVKAKSKK